MEPIVLDITHLREKRQEDNIKKTLAELTKPDITQNQVNKICNDKELSRTLHNLEITFDDFTQKCREDELFAKLASMNISKNASRQGTKDEETVLHTCNIVSETFGIKIINLNVDESRPTKDGKIISKNEYKQSGLKKNDCLKSFDGQIKGKINGWIFAKLTISGGGHQDNVFEEAHCMGEWMVKYGKPEEFYILLIDTDLTKHFNELYEKYHKNNILVVNHIDFQKFLINEGLKV